MIHSKRKMKMLTHSDRERETERERQINSKRKRTTKRKGLTGTHMGEDRKVPSSSVICFHVGF